jgi:hypothetical protein
MEKKLVLTINEYVFPFEFKLSDDQTELTKYFTDLFTNELQLIVDEYSKKENGNNLDNIIKNLNCTKITKNEFQITPWWSQGYLQECWFSEDKNRDLVVELPEFKIYYLDDWFASNKVVL